MVALSSLKKTILWIILLCLPLPTLAWNWVGHELIAQIAYDQLTPTEKKQWDKTLNALREVYAGESFIRASTLPDRFKSRGIDVFNSWHYINLPIVVGQQKTRPINPENIVWAIEKSLKILRDKKAKPFEKALFASFLIHCVGDIHQPLHTAELYNTYFPNGDRGGNMLLTHQKKMPNLHTYWDQGGGFLHWKQAKNKTALQNTARMLEKKYPPSAFGQRINMINIDAWAQESHHIAQQKAYAPFLNSRYATITLSYQALTEELTQQQITLAGYRLAKLFIENHTNKNKKERH